MNKSRIGGAIKAVGVILWIVGGIYGLLGSAAYTGVYSPQVRLLTFLVLLVPGATLWRVGRWIQRQGRRRDQGRQMDSTVDGDGP